MFQDAQLNRRFFAAFFDEAGKQASVAGEAAEAGKKAVSGARKLMGKRDVAMLAAGAGLAYGGKRIVDDVRAGERLRRESQQYGG